MKVRFKTEELEKYYVTPLDEIGGKLPFQRDIIKQFKKKMQILISINSIDELYNFRSLNFEQLKGERNGEYSIRLNRQYRLIFAITKEEEEDWVVEIILVSEISKHYEK